MRYIQTRKWIHDVSNVAFRQKFLVLKSVPNFLPSRGLPGTNLGLLGPPAGPGIPEFPGARNVTFPGFPGFAKPCFRCFSEKWFWIPTRKILLKIGKMSIFAEASGLRDIVIRKTNDIEKWLFFGATFLYTNRIIYLLEGPRTCRFLSPATENFPILDPAAGPKTEINFI